MIDAAGLVVSGLSFERGKIEAELERGFAQATEIADYLAMHGMPFREAHGKSGALVRRCEEGKKTIGALTAPEASKILGVKIPENEWARLRSLGRERLKRRPRPRQKGFVEKERKRIMAAFERLA